MTRNEAIDVLKANYPDAHYSELREAVDLAIKVLEEPDRKKGKWNMEWDCFFHRYVPVCSQCLRADAYKFDVCPNCGADMREDAVQKKGKWIWHDAKDGYFISAYSCSVCNFFSSTNRPNFCPGCGADMREEKPDE